MSKKMMKRSLALGALMAFVITGSAMAGNGDFILNGSETERVSVAGTYTLGSDDVTLDATKDGWKQETSLDGGDIRPNIITGVAGTTYNTNQEYVTIKLSDNQTLTLLPKSTDETSGAVAWTKIEGTDTSNVVINQKGNAAALGYFSKDEITAGNITLNGGKYAIYSANESDSHKLEATNEIEMSSTGRAVYAGGGTIEITAGTLDVVSTRESGAVALTANGSGGIDINADDVKLTGDIVALVKGEVSLDATNNITVNGAVQADAAPDGGATITVAGKNVTIKASKKDVALTEGAVQNATIKADGKVTITAGGNLAGLGVGDKGKDEEQAKHTVNSVVAKEIEIKSEGSYGLYANQLSAYPHDGSRVQNTLDAENITINSAKSGIYASNSAMTKVNAENALNINSGERGISGEFGYIDVEAGKVTINSVEAGIQSLGGGEININAKDSIKVTSSDNGPAILATGDSSVTIKSAVTQLTGNIVTEEYETIDSSKLKVDFNGTDSYLKGDVTTSDGAITTLNFNDGATWYVSGDSDSKVTNLGGNKGVISVEEARKGLVTVVNETNENLTLEVENGGSIGVDVKQGLQELKNTVLDAEGKSVIDNLDVDAIALQAAVKEVDGTVTTTIKPGGEFVIENSKLTVEGDVVAGSVSLKDTAAQVDTNTADIAANKADIAANKAAIEANTAGVAQNAQAIADNTAAIAKKVDNNATGQNAIAMGFGAKATANDSAALGYGADAGNYAATAIGKNAAATGSSATAIGEGATATASWSNAIGKGAVANGESGNAIGTNANASASDSTAIGTDAKASATYATAVGHEANAAGHAAVAIGDKVTAGYLDTAIGQEASAQAGGQGGAIAIGYKASADYISSTAVGREAKVSDEYSSAYGANSEANGYRSTAVGYKAVATNDGDVAIGAHSITTTAVSVDSVSVGGNTYTFAGNNTDGYVAAASVGGGESGSLTGGKTLYRQIQNVAAGQVNADSTDAVNGSQLYAAYQAIDAAQSSTSAAISGINQRLDRTNTKINKVGAGAAALAALHPLDYDPDDKLTFSAGMGNYAGENAAALGAFYRPDEKFMISVGGSMGNGENMVNLGLSIGLDKPNGLAKLSKKELIQKVNAVEAENDALEDRVAKLEALVAQLASK